MLSVRHTWREAPRSPRSPSIPAGIRKWGGTEAHDGFACPRFLSLCLCVCVRLCVGVRMSMGVAHTHTWLWWWCDDHCLTQTHTQCGCEDECGCGCDVDVMITVSHRHTHPHAVWVWGWVWVCNRKCDHRLVMGSSMTFCSGSCKNKHGKWPSPWGKYWSWWPWTEKGSKNRKHYGRAWKFTSINLRL